MPHKTLQWLAEDFDVPHRTLCGAAVFADISGFTALSERLAKTGREGAETVTEVINTAFDSMLAAAYANDGQLLFFGGDALLVMFEEPGGVITPDSTRRAAAAATGMRAALREVNQRLSNDSSLGVRVRLGVSMGLHAGDFEAALVGSRHKQLLLVGSATSEVVALEHQARTGEIQVSPAAAELLPPSWLRDTDDGRTLRRTVRHDHQARFDSLPAEAETLASQALSPPVAAHLGRGAFAPEHRTATVGFLQVRGLDAVTTRSPDTAAKQLDVVMSTVQEACEASGVTLLACDVDVDAVKVVLVAGAPTTEGEDEQRMLAALKAVVTTDLPLPVRAGAARGNVFVAAVGSEHRRTYTVMGDTVNLAARLMSRAEDDAVLATHDVTDRCRIAYQLRDIEPFRAKGKSQLVTAVEVGTPEASQAPVLRRTLLGRAGEIESLTAAWQKATSGAGASVQIVGEPGIGKSTLVGAVRDDIVGDDASVLSALTDVVTSSSPHAVSRQLLEAALASTGNGSPPLSLTEALRRWGPADDVLAAYGPLLADVTGEPLPTTPESDSVADEQRRAHTAAALVRLIRRCLRGPTLILVEDVHWADEASVPVLEELAKASADEPWLLLTTRRSHGDGYRQRTALGPVLTLSGLDADTADQLVISALADRRLAPSARSSLISKAGGNPLFLSELVAATRDGDDPESLPDTLDVLLSARLDRLDSPDRDLVRRASVLGQRFPTTDLALVVDEASTFGPAVWRRVAEFLVPTSDDEMAFVHALVRDSAYRRLPFRLRRTLHGDVADTLASRPGADLAVLSFHYAAAGRWSQTWQTSVSAGRSALAAYSPSEAAELLARALNAARRPDVVATDRERVEVALDLAKAHERNGDFDAAERAYAAAARVDDDLLSARVLVQRAWLAERQGALTTGVRRARQAQRRLAAKRRGAASWRAQAMTVEGTCLEVGGRHREAAEVLTRAFAEARRAGDRRTMAHAGSILDWSLAMAGRRSESPHLALALTIYEELGDLSGQATCLTNLGALAYLRGDWAQAVSHYQEGRRIQLRTGDATSAALGAANTAEVLSDQGHWDAAADLLADARQTWHSTGHRHGVAWVTGLEGRLFARRGDLDRAEETLGNAESLHADVGASGDAAQVRLWLTERHVLAADSRRALELLDAGADDGSPTALRVRATAMLEAGDDAAEHMAVAAFDAAADEPYERVLTGELLGRAFARPEMAAAAAPLREQLGVVRTAVLPVGYL